MSTANRRPHTVYLSDEAWNALERGYLQLRLSSSPALSKIEFVEQVLRAGLDVVVAHPAPDRDPVVSQPKAPVDHQAPTEPPPKQKEQRGRRPSAVERLRQASEPGRPAPIRSAADGQEQLASE